MLEKIKKIHFVGIKGVGMAALAILAKERGFEVSGSDSTTIFPTDDLLNNLKIKILPFAKENIEVNPDLVIVSAAYDKNHIEVKEAQKKHIPILPYSEALAEFSREKKTIAVSGIHGKTTTTAMLAYLLIKAKKDPSYIIGAGNVPVLGTIAHYGKGEYFILEADEYKKSREDPKSKFLDLKPQIEIITSIEMDHPDLFVSSEEVYQAFYKFACHLPREGFIVICVDYPKARKLVHSIADRNFETYGFNLGVRWKIVEFFEDDKQTIFSLTNVSQTKKYGPFKLKIPGSGNVLNATAAIIIALKLGVDCNLIKKEIANFTGVKRRFEKIAEKNGIVLIDDYAHHPRAISMTLETIRKKYPAYKIWAIFQPHTYSRTEKLLDKFATAFKFADNVYLTDIYASEREKKETISGARLAEEMSKYHRHVTFQPDMTKIPGELLARVKKPAVVITLGAGDIYKIHEDIKNKL